ncbi:hypothetical protein [Alloacidobacterium sp.]|uniref:hypothetical protein n=1 Tax=Alloacidobacterium sp. TaxID=2951999 RepID=UPI002D248C9D|nr:hypothetical protein [Alloacidobacterium sp.]HYK35463.1 hypothetical protein [Alloacidobacterium sp.]
MSNWTINGLIGEVAAPNLARVLLQALSLGAHAFLLQGHYVKEWAENTVMHVLVNDVHAWWQHIHSLDLAKQFGVTTPAPPRAEPWGLTVTYVFDPTGVLWHFAEATKS